MDFLLTSKKIEDFISAKVKAAGAKGVVIGLSGGLDSAVVATLSARALGRENVLALLMPSPTNSPRDMEDAKSLADSLKIRRKAIPIKSILEAFSEHLDSDKKATGNLMARIRMCLLYYHANRLNYLVAGTGNKSEISIGYFTKFGDGGCDILPIGDLYKTDVRLLAKSIGVPADIINRAPTAGLWEGQTDEGEIGLSYEELDSILAGKEHKESIRVKRMVNAAEHKRRLPETCKLRSNSIFLFQCCKHTE